MRPRIRRRAGFLRILAIVNSGHLVTLTSAAENDFVAAIIPSTSAPTFGPWLGGYQDPSDASPSEGWKWVTGEPWSFTDWGPGTPDDNGRRNPEYYLHYYFFAPNAPTWNDGDGAALTAEFIVEYE